MEIATLFRPNLLIERPLFKPPSKVVFERIMVEEGLSDAGTESLFEQFHIDLEMLADNIRILLRHQSQVPLAEVLRHYPPTKGMAEILGYVQIASREGKHYINNETTEELVIKNPLTGEPYHIKAPVIIFNK